MACIVATTCNIATLELLQGRGRATGFVAEAETMVEKTTAKIVAIRVQMPDPLRAQFKAQCALQSQTMNEVVIQLIEQWLAAASAR